MWGNASLHSLSIQVQIFQGERAKETFKIVVLRKTFRPVFLTRATVRSKTLATPRKNKVYDTSEDGAFFLQRCLWFNSEKYIDFFVFQMATLRLCRRATETSRLTVQNLSIRELCEGPPNKVLQCYLVRDKMGVDKKHPLIPNKSDVFGDLVVAIALALFIAVRC